ncbi:MAG: nucleotidyltransferase domain-containing protein [Ginsengibacter sp.]
MNNICQNILKTLAYFDIFNYPLTVEEIIQFLPEKNSKSAFDESLKNLLQEKLIFKIDRFYSLRNLESIASRRIEGNKRAAQHLRIARGIAKFLSGFPFVKSVCVSGSLSKDFADKKSDTDFFIITEADRLWTARSFMHLFKKLSYLAGKQHWFCMNYYVDEKGMEIVEKNIFTAMEIVTLKPMQGKQYFKRFIDANSWTKNYFPGQKISVVDDPIETIKLKRFIEKIFRSKLGDAIEKWLMDLTDKRWKKKTEGNKLNNHGERISMIVGPHFSKPNPDIFQLKIINEYDLRVNQLLSSYELIEIEQ